MHVREQFQPALMQVALSTCRLQIPAQQSGLFELVQGVVDGGLRHPCTLGAQTLEDRLGGEVLGRAQQQRGDLKALRRRLDATAAQALGDRMQGGRNQHEQDYRAIAGKNTRATDSAA